MPSSNSPMEKVIMIRLRHIASALVVATLGMNVSPIGIWGMSSANAETETVRPEVGKPLQAAQELLRNRKSVEALAKLAELDAIPNKTPYEIFIADRTKVAIASVTGDDALSIQALEAVIGSGRLQATELQTFIQALIGAYYRRSDYPKAITWVTRYYKEGGEDPKMRAMMIQSYYYSNEFIRAEQELRADVQADEKMGKVPSEQTLQLLLSCTQKLNDKLGYTDVIEKFVAYYPKKEHWNELIYRVQAKTTFSARLLLDVYRLKSSLGQLTAPNDFIEMAELARLDGFPAEAEKVMAHGYAMGILGVGNGTELARQKRLQERVNKVAAADLKTIAQGEADAHKSKDGTALVSLGYAYVTMGEFDKGISLMEQGIRKGDIKRTEDAKLHMAYAYVLAGRKPNGIQMFKLVQGADGTADLARYWVVHLTGPTAAPITTPVAAVTPAQ